MFWVDGTAQESHAFVWAASFWQLYMISWTVNCLDSYLTGSRHPPTGEKKNPSLISRPLSIPPRPPFQTVSSVENHFSPSWFGLRLWESEYLWPGQCQWFCFHLAGWTSAPFPGPLAGGAWASKRCPPLALSYPGDRNRQRDGPLLRKHHFTPIMEFNGLMYAYT